MNKNSDLYSEEETARRRDAVIEHMLNTPPKPHSEMRVGKRKAKAVQNASPPQGQSFIIELFEELRLLPNSPAARAAPLIVFFNCSSILINASA